MSLCLLISPAKRMVEPDTLAPRSVPACVADAERLVGALRALDADELQRLWHVSDKLAKENLVRLEALDVTGATAALVPAVLSFEGVQYQHLAAGVMDEAELVWLQAHLRILSGLYGVLRPLDGIRPYRLEMGAKLALPAPAHGCPTSGPTKDLYGFWGPVPLDVMAREVAMPTLVNLASKEYARAVVPWAREAGVLVLTCLFGDVREADGRLVQRATEAKAARGTFVRWCAEQRVADACDLRSFSERGYALDEGRSDAHTLVFVRDVIPAPWWLYVLRCADGSLYTGIATDVERRLAAHNSGRGAKYTRSHGPCEVVYREPCMDKSAALRRELEVKGLSRAQKLRLVAGA